jgi:hypothetical protein
MVRLFTDDQVRKNRIDTLKRWVPPKLPYLPEELGHELVPGSRLVPRSVHQFLRPTAWMVRFTIGGGVR